MSFFKDFKDDLSLAVNELLPGDDLELEDELEDSPEMMVNTLEGDLDIESELSKLDGLLEHVDAPEEIKHVRIEPEEPVLEQPKPEKEPQAAKAPAEPKEKPKEKPSREDAVEKMLSQFDTVLEKEEDIEKKTKPSFETAAREPEPASQPRPQPRQPVQAKPQPQRQPQPRQQPKPQQAVTQPEPEPAMKNTFQNQENRKPSTTIKEEIPMNDDLTMETTAVMDEDLSAEALEVTDEVSIITTGTTIKGNLSTTGSFSISGRVEGNVQCNGKLEVTGTIKGNSSSSEVFSDAAKIEGEIMSTGTVKIGLGSVVVGNISATSAVIAGAVKGDIDVQGPVVVDTSAVIVGNIKSRSVQINNGAVIEGFCSQCYADIDVDSLFGENKKGK